MQKTPKEKRIYLTFDAGFENGNTEAILDALKKHHVPATFFVVGTYIKNNPELIRRMKKEGHTVGNHTYHHPDMSQISTKESFEKDTGCGSRISKNNRRGNDKVLPSAAGKI